MYFLKKDGQQIREDNKCIEDYRLSLELWLDPVTHDATVKLQLKSKPGQWQVQMEGWPNTTWSGFRCAGLQEENLQHAKNKRDLVDYICYSKGGWDRMLFFFRNYGLPFTGKEELTWRDNLHSSELNHHLKSHTRHSSMVKNIEERCAFGADCALG